MLGKGRGLPEGLGRDTSKLDLVYMRISVAKGELVMELCSTKRRPYRAGPCSRGMEMIVKRVVLIVLDITADVDGTIAP